MKTKHTPGHWKVSKMDHYRHLRIYTGKEYEEFSICQITPYYWGGGRKTPKVYSQYTDERLKANARLICSAPELLKALKMIIKSADFINTRQNKRRVTVAKTAIAKAEET